MAAAAQMTLPQAVAAFMHNLPLQPGEGMTDEVELAPGERAAVRIYVARPDCYWVEVCPLPDYGAEVDHFLAEALDEGRAR